MLTNYRTPKIWSQATFIRFILQMRSPFAIAAIAAVVIGVLVNFVSFNGKLQPFDGGGALHPVTAICLLGLSMSVLKTRRFGHNDYWRTGVLSFILLVCSARIMDVTLTSFAGGASILAFGPTEQFGGQFNTAVAIAIGAFSASILLRQSNARVGGCWFAIGAGTVFCSFVQLTYGQRIFSDDIGAFTVVALISVSVAMTSLYVHRPLVRVLLLEGDIGIVTRVMAASVIGVPWFVGLMMQYSGQPTSASVPSQAAMMAAITCIMLATLLMISALSEGTAVARLRTGLKDMTRVQADPVTGALKNLDISDVVEGAWLEFRGAGALYGVILMDLAYFRDLDTAFGKGEPDAVMHRIIDTLTPQLRADDIVDRWGANEVAVVLRIKDRSDLDLISKRIQTSMSDAGQPFCAGLDAEPETIDVSLGMSTMEIADNSAIDSILRASNALQYAKKEADGRIDIHNGFVDTSFMFTDDDLGFTFEAEPKKRKIASKAA